MCYLWFQSVSEYRGAKIREWYDFNSAGGLHKNIWWVTVCEVPGHLDQFTRDLPTLCFFHVYSLCWVKLIVLPSCFSEGGWDALNILPSLLADWFQSWRHCTLHQQQQQKTVYSRWRRKGFFLPYSVPLIVRSCGDLCKIGLVELEWLTIHFWQLNRLGLIARPENF